MKKYFLFLVSLVFAFTFVACSDDDDNEQPVVSPISILYNNEEVKNNEVISYEAKQNEFGEIVAGEEGEPVFVPKSTCKLEVAVTLPEQDFCTLQWCGITGSCAFLETADTYVRVAEKFAKQDPLGMEAFFTKYGSCLVKVNVKANDKQERVFYIQYNYPEIKK